jgi:estrogen-related receptor beta like 1
MDDADEPARGRSLELAHEPDVASELLVEKLKLLRYERDFLATRRPAWPPVTRHAFLSPSGNGGEQFHRFTSLAAFLARLAGDATHRAPEQFDDPNVACSDIFAALRRLGFETPAFAPGKLRSGRGAEAVAVLSALADAAVEREYRGSLGRPKYAPDQYPEEPDIEDDAFADAGGEGANANGADEPETDEESDDDDDAAYAAPGGAAAGAAAPPSPAAAAATAEELEETAAIESAVDAAEWKLELERVAPQLRVIGAQEAKDWRAHLESAKKHRARVAEAFPDVKASLERVAADVEQTLDKIEQRERFVNDQLEPLAAEYRAERERLNETQEKHDRSAEYVAGLSNELAKVSERLEEVRATAANRGEDIADTTPLNNLKASIAKLDEEMKVMEVKIGVVRGTLLRVSMKKRDAAARAPGKENKLASK